MFTPFDKAITAFITPTILMFLLPFGITGDMTVEHAIAVLGTAVVTAITVHFTKNKRG